MRLDRARTTKDVDLWMKGDAAGTLERLQKLGELDLGDFLSFIVEPDKDHPVMKGEGMVYEGQRFRCEARLAGKLYGGRFGIDVGFADDLTVEPDLIEGSSFLDFAGAERTTMRIYPRVAHVAEKLHAYTLPRERENTRVKDLPDLALLASLGSLDGDELRKAIDATFTFRKTHNVPAAVPDPPPSWDPVYALMADADEL
ncbi:MAG: nucleotidyl transferase AbiEii/AbiGii toxin family protein, partial [Myxococcota bacterium]